MEEILPFKDHRGQVIAELRIVIDDSKGDGVLCRISEADAEQYGEETLQLLESTSYQYEFRQPGITLESIPGTCSSFLVGTSDLDRGSISTGLNTGALRLHALRDGRRVASASVEVRSAKLGYREDYRRMLEDISEISLDLLLHLPAPAETRIEVDETEDVAEVQQRFFFLRSLIDSEDFDAAIQQIVRQPHSKLLGFQEERALGGRIGMGAEVNRQIASAFPRRSIPATHPLGTRLDSVPQRVVVNRYEESVDTPENRFVRSALVMFDSFFEGVEARLLAVDGSSAALAQREVVPLRLKLAEYLAADFFAELSDPDSLPVGSPVLQRKAGYREVLRAWLKFGSGARLVWAGGDEVFGAGKRDVATLYEYWLFFVLWRTVAKWIGDDAAMLAENLLEKTHNGFGLKLRTGEALPLPGTKIEHNGKELRLQFSYNRTFGEAPTSPRSGRLTYLDSYPLAGSWTRRMRPDFTISLWPAKLDRSAAEETDRIKHIHFDAKYSVNSIMELFGSAEEDLSAEKRLQKTGTFKRGDLLKMHAYHDAIRRSRGAYILYPGSDADGAGAYHLWQKYHEVLPGVGAFVVRPRDVDEDESVLVNFLSDVLDQMSA